ncbi:MAG: phosphatidate phosphatase APP1 [Maribacter sp.]
MSYSPWHLYYYLELFFRTNNFPTGPILLRRISSLRAKKRKIFTPHKQCEIIAILKIYLSLSFIPIGDGGKKDVDI